MPCVFSSSRPSFFSLLRLIVPCRCCRAGSDPPLSPLPALLVTMALALPAGSAIPITQIPNHPNPDRPNSNNPALPAARMLPNGCGAHPSLCSFPLEISPSHGEGMELRETRMEDVLTLVFLQESALLQNPWKSLLTPGVFIFGGMELVGQDLRCPKDRI